MRFEGTVEKKLRIQFCVKQSIRRNKSENEKNSRRIQLLPELIYNI